MRLETLTGQGIEKVFKEGEKRTGRNITAFTLEVKDRTRFGIIVTKKNGTACIRNRIKRRVKEALRVLMPNIHNTEVVLIPRAGINKISITEIVKELSSLIPGCGK